MTSKLPKTESLFDCANLIKPLKCSKCANFETHHLAHLKHHFKADHTLLEWEEKRYRCESCIFLTHSKYLWLKHKLLNLCTGGGKVKNEQDGDLECDSVKSKLSKCEHRPYTRNHLKRNNSVKNTRPDRSQWLECAQRPQATVNCNGNNLTCDQCKFKTKRRRTMRDHITAKHTDCDRIQWLHCAQCSFRCKTKPSDLKCDHCPFETKHKQSLTCHVVAKHNKPGEIQWFQCAQCPLKYLSKYSLRSHVNNKHRVKKITKCDHCAFETSCKHSLKTHNLLTHAELTKLPTLHCEYCSYTAKNISLLDSHFNDKHIKNKHEKKSLKNAHFDCAKCSYRTNRRSCLDTHVERVHAFESESDRCQFETESQNEPELRQSPRPTDPIQWFRCEHCSFKYTKLRRLKRHVRKWHGL